eukprot:322643-Rhodomonas_salina.1
MEFEIEPVPSNIDSGTLEAAGLRKLAEHDRWGCDHTTFRAGHDAVRMTLRENTEEAPVNGEEGPRLTIAQMHLNTRQQECNT